MPVSMTLGARRKAWSPVRQAPFYLAEVWPVVSNTQGGPVHDEKRRVVNAYWRADPAALLRRANLAVWVAIFPEKPDGMFC